MAMILDAFMSKFSNLLADFVHEEVIMLLGVKDELHTLGRRMRRIQCLLEDAEKKKFDESSTELWLSELKDVMYDAEDIIDLCRIDGTMLLADRNPEPRTSSVRCNFSSAFSCFTSVPLRHEIGNRIKDINERLKQIYEDRERYKLEKSTMSETPQITLVDSRQTSSMNDPVVVGREVEVAANSLVDRLLGEKVDEKCRLFAVTGMGGIGKTTLAQRIFNHSKIKTFFNLDPVWVCVSQTYSEIELLKHVIEGVKGRYEDSNTKSKLQTILSDSVASGHSLFLVLDDVWRADVWFDLFRVPLYNSNGSVRILITTRDENVAKEIQAAYIHPVTHLSEESSWDMLRRRLFSEEEEEIENGLKEIGLKLVNKCKGLPLAIKVVAGVLLRKPQTKKAWENFFNDNAWSIYNLPRELSGALFLSFEDLPSYLKQCFLYFSLYPEDARLDLHEFAQLWVAEGFITKQQDSLTEDLAEECFNELLNRNLLLPKDFFNEYKMHIQVLPDSIGKLVHLRYLNLSYTFITAIPESIGQLTNLQFLDIYNCLNLRQLPSGITQLHNLRRLDILQTPIIFIPNGIEKLQHLNYLSGFVVANNDSSSSKLEELNSLKQIRTLNIGNLKRPQSEKIVLKELPNLSTLTLSFSEDSSSPNEEQELAIEELFDKIIPPKSLENFKIDEFFGRRFPNWMVSSSFEICLPNLTKLSLWYIKSCTQLPPLGQLPELRELDIVHATKVKKIGLEFFGRDVNPNRIAFPKLERLLISNFPQLEEWSFGSQVEKNARFPCLQKLTIWECWLLKQLPEGLKYSPMKILEIRNAGSLKSVDNLPAEIEELTLIWCKNLKKVCCAPTLKILTVYNCEALSCVEKKFDSLQRLVFADYDKTSFPEWLLKLLQQRGLQNESNDDFYLELQCRMEVFRECLEGGSYWDLIQHISHVKVSGREHYLKNSKHPVSLDCYLRYSKQPYVYETKL